LKKFFIEFIPLFHSNRGEYGVIIVGDWLRMMMQVLIATIMAGAAAVIGTFVGMSHRVASSGDWCVSYCWRVGSNTMGAGNGQHSVERSNGSNGCCSQLFFCHGDFDQLSCIVEPIAVVLGCSYFSLAVK